MSTRKKVVLGLLVTWLAIALLVKFAPLSDDSGGAAPSGGGFPAAQPEAVKGPADSFVRVADWDNKSDEDLNICLRAVGPNWDSDPVCWRAGAHKGNGFGSGPIDVPCRADMTSLVIGTLTIDAEPVNGEEERGDFCHGDSHGYRVTVTASGRIDWQRAY